MVGFRNLTVVGDLLSASMMRGQMTQRRSSYNLLSKPAEAACNLGRQYCDEFGQVSHRHFRRVGERPQYGQYLAGGISPRKSLQRRSVPHLTGEGVSVEWLRPLGHDRQRLGVGLRLVHTQAPSRCGEAAARHTKPIDTSTSRVGFRCVVRQDNAC